MHAAPQLGGRARLAQQQQQQQQRQGRRRPPPSREQHQQLPKPPPPIPRRAVAARRLLSAVARPHHPPPADLSPYLWTHCSDGSGTPLPAPPESWKRAERVLREHQQQKQHQPPSLLLPLLAAPPSSLLLEREVLSSTASAAPDRSGRCMLSRRGLLSPCVDRDLEVFFAGLFEAAVVGRRRRRSSGGEGGGAPQPPEIELSRHDLFHAHVFVARVPESDDEEEGELHAGLLFHAAEYPRRTILAAEEEEREEEGGSNGVGSATRGFTFPHDLGHCQRDSRLVATPEILDWRNTIYLAGRMAAFSVGAGVGSSGGGNSRCRGPPTGPHSAPTLGNPLRPLLRPGTAPLRTVYEEDLGVCVGPDVLCFRASDVAGGGGGVVCGAAPLRSRRLLPPPVETSSLGPLHVFVSY